MSLTLADSANLQILELCEEMRDKLLFLTEKKLKTMVKCVIPLPCNLTIHSSNEIESIYGLGLISTILPSHAVLMLL